MPGARLKLAFLKSGDHILELFEYLSPKGKPYDRRTCDVGSSHVCFFVADINEAYNTLSAKGVPFKSAPQAIEMGGETHWACYMTDPDGITLELYQ
jgi:catechol 2,3-dioxygenase-like lactoylglutathione lyase family enzyme